MAPYGDSRRPFNERRTLLLDCTGKPLDANHNRHSTRLHLTSERLYSHPLSFRLASLAWGCGTTVGARRQCVWK